MIATQSLYPRTRFNGYHLAPAYGGTARYDIIKRNGARPSLLGHDRMSEDFNEVISTSGCYKLIKLDFAVEGTRISPKASSNRCILFVDEDMRVVKILLVYSKNDISPPNETCRPPTE